MHAIPRTAEPPCGGASSNDSSDSDDPNDSEACRARLQLPPAVEAALWRGSDLGSPCAATLPSGHAQLDALLPGNGWPTRALTELLQPQPALAEWRLLAPAMRATSAARRDIVVVAPPKSPHLPGLRDEGIDERHVVWVQATTPAERLWTTEQLVKANATGMVVAWLPQARQEQIRRLQVCALACDCPVFLCRPLSAVRESSAAPLRLEVTHGVDWELHVRILKRRGSTHDEVLRLASMPRGLVPLLTPRLAKPSALIAAARRRARVVSEDLPHALGRPSAGPRPERLPAH